MAEIKLYIDDLDPESCALLDIMWVMDNEDELNLWRHCLPNRCADRPRHRRLSRAASAQNHAAVYHLRLGR